MFLSTRCSNVHSPFNSVLVSTTLAKHIWVFSETRDFPLQLAIDFAIYCWAGSVQIVTSGKGVITAKTIRYLCLSSGAVPNIPNLSRQCSKIQANPPGSEPGTSTSQNVWWHNHRSLLQYYHSGRDGCMKQTWDSLSSEVTLKLECWSALVIEVIIVLRFFHVLPLFFDAC